MIVSNTFAQPFSSVAKYSPTAYVPQIISPAANSSRASFAAGLRLNVAFPVLKILVLKSGLVSHAITLCEKIPGPSPFGTVCKSK